MMGDEKVHANHYLIWIIFAAAFGGLLFGYDQGVMSGAINFIGHTFKMTSGLEGFISGCIPLGAVVGCLIAGWCADKLGRKIVLFISALLFTISTLGCGFAPSIGILVASRLIGGLGVGMCSTLVPLYIAEISPKEIRGRFVGSYQLAIATGIFIVYLVNALITNTHSTAWNNDIGWRMMFFAGAIPGVLFFIMMFFIPESPRFLVSQRKVDAAKQILLKVTGNQEQRVQETLGGIQQTVSEERDNNAGWGELFKKGVRWALFVAIMCSVFQQLTGINAVGYYAPIIFRNAGAGIHAAMIETIGIGLVKVLFVAFFMGLIDKLGRKRLLVWGGYAMAVCMFLLAFAFDQTSISRLFDIFIFALIIIHTSAFEMSWGGGTWVLISEMFPNRIRGRASSIASAALWAATYAVTQLFPMMLAHLGDVWTFIIFGVCCVAMGLFVKCCFRETAGKSLEQIEADTVQDE